MEEENSNYSRGRPPLFWKSCRLTYTICAFLTITCHMIMRMNLSFALVCMIKSPDHNNNGSLNSVKTYTIKEVSDNDKRCLNEASNNNKDSFSQGEVIWSKENQGLILSAFFYGYVIFQPIGGLLSDKYGGKFFLIFGLLSQGLCNLLFPAAARYNFVTAFTVRCLQGLFAGFGFPAVNQLYYKWAHSTERTNLMSLAYSGQPISMLLVFPLSGYLCQIGIDNGWPLIFYFTGTVSSILSIILIWLVYDDIDNHPRISSEEYEYLKEGNTPAPKIASIPWIKILKSTSINAYIATHFLQVWGYVTFAMMLPQFIKEVLFFDTKWNGILSALPYLSGLISRILISISFRPLHKMTKFSLTNFRKCNHLFGTILPAIFLFIVTILTCHQAFWIIFLIALTSAVIDLGFIGSYFLSILEIAPLYIGLISGISNSLSNLSAILTPNITNLITKSEMKDEWNNVFYIIICFYCISGFIYSIFGSSEPETWGHHILTEQ